MWCVADNHSYMCHMCAKEFLDSNFDKAVIAKISNFHEIAPNFTYSQKLWFFKYNWNFLDQLLLPYKFHGRDMWGMYFFIFASCEPLIILFSRKMPTHDDVMVLVWISAAVATKWMNWISNKVWLQRNELILLYHHLWRVTSYLTLSTRMSSADDRSKFSTFFFLQNFSKFKLSLPYLNSAWKMHLFEYKQAYVWFSGSWDNPLNFEKIVSNFKFSWHKSAASV